MTDHNAANPTAACPVCRAALSLRPVQGRKSRKAFLMLICPVDGRHFRGFISDRTFVNGLLARLEGQTPSVAAGGDLDAIPDTGRSSITNLEGANES